MKYLLLLIMIILSGSLWAQTCTNAGTAYALQPTSNGIGYQLCPPGGGTPVCYNAVSKVDDADLQRAGTANAVRDTKYGGAGSWSPWALGQSNRLAHMGFTAAGQYSYRFMQPPYHPSGGLPYAPVDATSGDAVLDYSHPSGLGPFREKDLGYIPNTSGMKCGSSFYQGTQADPYGPNFQTAATSVLTSDFFGNSNWDMTKAIIALPDEADFLFGIDGCCSPLNAHPDVGLMIASSLPSVPHSRANVSLQANYGTLNFSQVQVGVPDGTHTTYVITGTPSWASGCVNNACAGLTWSWIGFAASGGANNQIAVATSSANATSGSASATESGNTVTLTLASGNFNASFVVGGSVTVAGCSVTGYNVTSVIISGGSGTNALTYNDPTGSLGAATGCTASVVTIVVLTSTQVNETHAGTATETYVYTDHELYAKFAMRDFMMAKYTTLAAWNLAWGTSYSTKDTIDAGGVAGITNGTYSVASWGSGPTEGFLDENGTNLVKAGQSCGGISGNGPQQNEAWSNPTQIQLDIDAFVAALAGTYTSKMRIGFNAGCGTTCPPMIIPAYNGPSSPASSSVYAAMAPSVDGFWIAIGSYSSLTAIEDKIQEIINNDGGKPVIVANYYIANPDSWETSQICFNLQGIDCASTQSTRGSQIATLDRDIFLMKNPNGKYPVFGSEKWALYDSDTPGDLNNYGLFTPNDNGYDGSNASTISGTPSSCITNHPYTQPAICIDTNGNYESLRTFSCKSAVSGTSWPSNVVGNYYLQTTDGTCQWINISPNGAYPLTAEVGTFGNALGAISDQLLKANCNPTSILPPTKLTTMF